VEGVDTVKFRRDPWDRPEGGGGESRVLSEGSVFERAGVSFSHVFRRENAVLRVESAAGNGRRSLRSHGPVAGLSSAEPLCPTTHCNVRFLVATPGGLPPVWWFGGGFDLTPYYPFDEDVLHWHRTARTACAPFGRGMYEKYKAWCDRYFFLPHRNETRGVGGLFFDDYSDQGFDHSFSFMRSVATIFSPPICQFWSAAC